MLTSPARLGHGIVSTLAFVAWPEEERRVSPSPARTRARRSGDALEAEGMFFHAMIIHCP